MSQNKTRIQGLETADAGGKANGGYARGGGSDNFYSRGNGNKGTYVPGMESTHRRQANYGANGTEVEGSEPRRGGAVTGKPVVGFLYSVSRTAAGEYWPLQIGKNTIGQRPSSDISLAEATVSGDHAVLVVRQLKGTKEIIAAVTDTMSTNGTLLNGETIGFQPVECHNGDIITIGNNYELLIILIDATKLNLEVSKSFMPVDDEEEEEDEAPIFNGGGNTNPGAYDPTGNPAAWGTTGMYSPGGTVGLDGSMAGARKGGTMAE